MLITLNILVYILKAIEILAVSLILVIGVDLAIYTYNLDKPTTPYGKLTGVHRLQRKEKLRVIRQKEKEANEGFFEESYVQGFDSTGAMLYRGCQVPSEKGRTHYETMEEIDRLVDGQIFDNTKEL